MDILRPLIEPPNATLREFRDQIANSPHGCGNTVQGYYRELGKHIKTYHDQVVPDGLWSAYPVGEEPGRVEADHAEALMRICDHFSVHPNSRGQKVWGMSTAEARRSLTNKEWIARVVHRLCGATGHAGYCRCVHRPTYIRQGYELDLHVPMVGSTAPAPGIWRTQGEVDIHYVDSPCCMAHPVSWSVVGRGTVCVHVGTFERLNQAGRYEVFHGRLHYAKHYRLFWTGTLTGKLPWATYQSIAAAFRVLMGNTDKGSKVEENLAKYLLPIELDAHEAALIRWLDGHPEETAERANQEDRLARIREVRPWLTTTGVDSVHDHP